MLRIDRIGKQIPCEPCCCTLTINRSCILYLNVGAGQVKQVGVTVSKSILVGNYSVGSQIWGTFPAPTLWIYHWYLILNLAKSCNTLGFIKKEPSEGNEPVTIRVNPS